MYSLVFSLVENAFWDVFLTGNVLGCVFIWVEFRMCLSMGFFWNGFYTSWYLESIFNWVFFGSVLNLVVFGMCFSSGGF